MVTLHNGKTSPKDNGTEYPVYGSNGQIGQSSDFNFEAAVILGRVGANCGSVEMCTEKFWASDNTIVVKPKDGFDLRFIYYRLKSVPLNSLAGGAAQPLLTQRVLKRYLIMVPKLSAQVEIASILSSLDDLIKNNRRRIALLDEAVQQLYKEWFVRFRFPGCNHITTVDEIPDGWHLKELGQLAVIKKGQNITKATTEKGGIPVVAGGLKPAYFHNVANTEAPVITISASGANAGYVAIYLEDIWASDCSYLSISENNSYVWYWYATLKSRQAEITSMQQGAAQPHIYPKHLKRIQVPMPPTRLVSKFTDLVEHNFLQMANLQMQIKQLVKAQEILLPKLMSGEIMV